MPRGRPLPARGRRSEDYLKTIYMLKERKGVVRVKDIAEELGVRAPSVVNFLEELASEGLIIYEKRERIDLTDKGLKIARDVRERHEAIKNFLKLLLNIGDEEAEADACYIEHGVGDETLERIRMFIRFTRECPINTLPLFLKHLYYYYRTGSRPPECSECPHKTLS